MSDVNLRSITVMYNNIFQLEINQVLNAVDYFPDVYYLVFTMTSYLRLFALQ